MMKYIFSTWILSLLLINCNTPTPSLSTGEFQNYVEVKTFFNANDPDTPIPDTYPSYPGGIGGLLEDINHTLRYPEEMQARAIEGEVIAKYMIETDGSIGDITILQGVYPDLDREVRRTIRSLKPWQPALKNGEPIRVGLVQPFYFSIKN